MGDEDRIDPQEFFDVSDSEIDQTIFLGRPLNDYSARELAAALVHIEKQHRSRRASFGTFYCELMGDGPD